jgi:hypothetical protein
VSEDRVLRPIFGPERKEVSGGRRRLHNELHKLCSSPNIIRVMKPRRMRWTGHVTRTRDMRNADNILVAKPKGRRLRRREDSIRIDFGAAGWELMYGIRLALDMDRWRALGNTIVNFRVP